MQHICFILLILHITHTTYYIHSSSRSVFFFLLPAAHLCFSWLLLLLTHFAVRTSQSKYRLQITDYIQITYHIYMHTCYQHHLLFCRQQRHITHTFHIMDITYCSQSYYTWHTDYTLHIHTITHTCATSTIFSPAASSGRSHTNFTLGIFHITYSHVNMTYRL